MKFLFMVRIMKVEWKMIVINVISNLLGDCSVGRLIGSVIVVVIIYKVSMKKLSVRVIGFRLKRFFWNL